MKTFQLKKKKKSSFCGIASKKWIEDCGPYTLYKLCVSSM